MSSEQTNLQHLHAQALEQIGAVLGQLPTEDFERLCKATLANGAGSLFSGALFAVRQCTDKRVWAFASASLGEHKLALALRMERLGEAAGGDAGVRVTGRAAALQAEGDRLFEQARGWLAEDDAEDGNHVKSA